uniref:Retrovirus-related Pol polyprotein from transposon TNT 1-94 n=1 Tax=Tanacetum cinerariifolium TaxID=118510 RepID=A0A6L2NBU5_TANCI|nr:hypothetical protein [Tanacetum cinerariifolium]
MVPHNKLGHDLNGKAVNETQYKGFDLKGYSDSDYAGCNMDKKSTSAKVEYVAAAGCCANILWMKSQLTNYDIIYEKNKPLFTLFNFIRDHILKGDIELHFILTQYQLDDIFTKPLDETTFKRFIVELGFDLKGYSDSDYAGCNMDKKSTSAAAGCCANILWMKSQLTDYDIIYEKEAAHSPTSHSKNKKKYGTAKDKAPSQPSVSTFADTKLHKEDIQAFGDPTSLGVTSKEGAHPQLSSDESEEEETKKDEYTHTTSHDVPKDTSVPHPPSPKLAQIQELMAQVHLLQSQKEKLVQQKAKAEAEVASLKVRPTYPDINQLTKLLAKQLLHMLRGEITNPASKDAKPTNLHNELVDLLGIDIVTQYYNKKLLYDKYYDKMLKRRKSSKIINCDVLTQKGPITFPRVQNEKIYKYAKNVMVTASHAISDAVIKKSSIAMTRKLDDMIELPKSQPKRTYNKDLEREIVMVKIPKCMAWLDDEPIGDLDTMKDKVIFDEKKLGSS